MSSNLLVLVDDQRWNAKFKLSAMDEYFGSFREKIDIGAGNVRINRSSARQVESETIARITM